MAEVCKTASDFILFPQDHSPVDNFGPPPKDNLGRLQGNHRISNDMHRHRDLSGNDLSSYEQYPSVSTYPSVYFEASNTGFAGTKGLRSQPLRRDPSFGSPSPSVSQGFDNPSSTLSSASGASAHSTASSADGSPYANAAHILSDHEKWPEPLHGLGIAPEIASGEGFNEDQFQPLNFENALLLESNKFPDYVGEYQNTFLSSLPPQLSQIVSAPSAPVSQNARPAIPSPCSALEKSAGAQSSTMDSLYEEANHQIACGTPLPSPVFGASAIATPSFFNKDYPQGQRMGLKTSSQTPQTAAFTASRFSSLTTSPQRSVGCVPETPLGWPSSHHKVQTSPRRPFRHFRRNYCPKPAVSDHGRITV